MRGGANCASCMGIGGPKRCVSPISRLFGRTYPTLPVPATSRHEWHLTSSTITRGNIKLITPSIIYSCRRFASSTISFDDLQHLHPSSKKAVARVLGLSHMNMTEIQIKTFDAASSGKDVLGRARTGSGKTLAFLLPAIQTIINDKSYEPGKSVGVIVLSPTRELALQIHQQAQAIVSCHDNLTSQVVFGGTSKRQDVQRFARRLPTILVATPGRLIDHLQATDVRGKSFAEFVRKTRVLVLDETDRLLDMGFKREIGRILSFLSPERQTLLFSATLPPDVRSIVADTMRPDYVTVDCIHDFDPASHTNAQVEQSCIIHPESMQIDSPIKILRHIMESDPNHKVIAFFPTANLTSYYSQIMNFVLNKPVIEIHSRKSQAFRTSASNRFREKEDGVVMFTSDVSARGVDYPGVTHVVQIGIPDSRETYIHRLGRTGRAGRNGKGLLVLSEMERGFLTNALDGLSIDEIENVDLMGRKEFADSASELDRMRQSVRDGRNVSLSRAAKSAYSSMLGYYAAKLRMLGVRDKQAMVRLVNCFSAASGLAEPPSISAKIAESIGLKGVPGINISKKKGGGGGGGVVGPGFGQGGNIDTRGKGRGRKGQGHQWQRGQRKRRNDEDGGGSVRGKGNYDGWGITNRWSR